ncbi:MAG: VOC family protein [Steroidobacteraceae bacterium]
MRNSVSWFEIYVQDLARARTFYEATLGVKLSKLDSPGMEMLAFPMERGAAGASGALVKMPGFESGSNSVLVYFICDDCAHEAAKAVKAGGGIHKEKTSIGQYGFIAHIIDTEGNMVGLHSMK